MELKKGINLGGWFSQCNKDEGHYKSFITQKDFARIKEMTFDHVRIPVDYDFLVDQDFNPTSSHFELLDQAFQWCRENSLGGILDLHKAPGYDFTQEDNHRHRQALFCNIQIQDQFIELWKLLARRYKDLDFIAFELLNEVVDGENTETWNLLIKRAVREIRREGCSNTIIYGGTLWNSARTLQFLQEPEDSNIMFSFHYYEPLIFTHQKAYWIKGMNPYRTIDYPGDRDYYKRISYEIGLQGLPIQNYRGEMIDREFTKEFLKSALLTAGKYGTRLYCAEFGVIDKAPQEATYNWFKDMIEVFREYNIGYSLWTYRQMDFGITEEHYQKVVELLEG